MSRDTHLKGSADRDVPSGGDNKHLQIGLLGSPRVFWHGETLSIPRRQVRALLYRLAANLQPVPRDQICYLFWPEKPVPKAYRSLSHLLTHLRRALPQTDLVDISKEYVALNRNYILTDTVALDECFSTRHNLLKIKPGSETDSAPALEGLEQIVQSYRGAFLDGFALNTSQEFENWVNLERQHYECRYLEILLDLIDYYLQRKLYENAITYARRYLAIDNLAEEVHCRLIELYAAIGDRSSAERQFDLCVATLEQELGISPSPKTWAVYQSASGTHPPGLLVSSPGFVEKSRTKREIPFVGRDEILEAVSRLYNLAFSGRSSVILISGEPGIGKSRLLQHIASIYHCTGTVLFSACSQGLGNLPFHPIAEALRPVIGSQILEFKISPIWLAEAARLLPEIYSRFPDLQAPIPARPEEARRRLFEGLYQLTTTLQSRFRPLLIVLDDLHWSDPTSVEWLIYFVTRTVSDGLGHILMVGTYRSEEIQSLAELRSVLNRLGVMDEYLLSGLTMEDVIQILQHQFGAHENLHNLATRLHQISGGNPFFLFETLQAFVDSNLVPGQSIDLQHFPIPNTVQEAIHQRLVHLSALERKILDVVAVLGDVINLEMAQEVIDSSELQIIESLDALVYRHLLIEQQGVYQFLHELLRLVIYNDIRYDQRRRLHRLCAGLLERFFPDKIALLAWHFEQSGEPGKAAGYALRAGEHALQVLAFPEALNFFSRALVSLKDAATGLSAPDEVAANYHLQIQALSQRSRIFRSLGEMAPFQDDLAEQARIANALGDQSTLAIVSLREANAHRWFCRYQQAQECAEKALQLSQLIENRCLQARARREIGLAQRSVGDFKNAEVNLQEALGLFCDLGESGYEIHTLGNLATLYTYMGDFRRAEKLAYAALARCEQAKIPYLQRIALADLGVALIGSQQIKQARECLLSSLDLAREIADRTQEIFCLCHLGWLENYALQPDQALGYLRNGLALAERLDSRSEQSRLYAGLAEVHRLQGNLRLARSFACKSLELAKKHGRSYDQNFGEQILAKIEQNL